ncbi:glycosyl transferase, putative [Shewanella violacea DSS12]|uniref:Glycosyl transferase, putative n=1 Tax=Shewanella violacea (strain JCM 10179 / CIP 106290 / LMG 19151 / DSS12) TaxID=637905 RepID=D4ZIE8_SHEVD|nr:glycosyl transferase, putative [Shewanella violacea DSS12]
MTSTQSSSESPVHGGGEYAKFVFYAALKFSKRLVCFYDAKRELDKSIFHKCTSANVELIAIESHKDISELLERDDIQTLYSALPYEYDSLELHGKRFVGTVHGIRSVECPTDKFEYIYKLSKKSQLRSFVGNLVKSRSSRKENAKKSFAKLLYKSNFEIITDSIHSKYSMLAHYPELNSENIVVFRCPYNFDKTSIKESLKSRDYFLLVSANRWIKNNYRSIIALDQLFSEQKLEQNVVVLGCGEVDFSKHVVNRDKFIFEGYVEETKLNDYFSNAYAFIYSTLNEGYGYPPIKAMEYGTPVLASSNTSVHEVCKDAAIYFNPLSISELKTRILTLVNEQSLREKIIENGFQVVEDLKGSNQMQLDDIVHYIFEIRDEYA